MIPLIDNWIKSISKPNKPFLMIGKGPTLSLESNIQRSKYISIGLNHVSSKYDVDIAHAIDLEVLIECGSEIYKKAKYLLMPWYPNYKFNPHNKNLQELLNENETIKSFYDSGRLLTYNRANGLSPHPDGGVPVLPRFFSGDTVFQLLSLLNEKKIYSIGVDGGTQYSSEFSNLKSLENGRSSFDDQFLLINYIENNLKSKLIKLGNLETIQVFVGSQKEQTIPSLVLKNSIMKNTDNPVSFNLLCDFNVSYNLPKEAKNKPRTPFSFQRFLIPSLTKGKAFYLDSDMQVFSDMAELLNIDFGDSEVLACSGMSKYGHWKGSEYAVLLMDCDKINWNINSIINDLDNDRYSYEQLMFEFKLAKVAHKISADWNSLDVFEQGTTKLLHYTDMARQPWRYKGHPFEHLWTQELKDCIINGTISKDLYESHVKNNYIRSNL